MTEREFEYTHNQAEMHRAVIAAMCVPPDTLDRETVFDKKVAIRLLVLGLYEDAARHILTNGEWRPT